MADCSGDLPVQHLPSRRFVAGGLLAAGISVNAAGAMGQTAAGPLIAAASDHDSVLPELLAAFERDQGPSFVPFRVVYGASANLARQVRQGAPFELFLSADADLVADLVAASVATAGAIYALGRLAALFYRGHPLSAQPSLEVMLTGLNSGQLPRLAMANPAFAPYGVRATEVLAAMGITLEPRRIVLGETVAQAAQLVATGAVPVGLVALSTALKPAVAAVATHTPVSAALHRPLRQQVAMTLRASARSQAFAAFLAGQRAAEIFAAGGFDGVGSH